MRNFLSFEIIWTSVQVLRLYQKQGWCISKYLSLESRKLHLLRGDLLSSRYIYIRTRFSSLNKWNIYNYIYLSAYWLIVKFIVSWNMIFTYHHHHCFQFYHILMINNCCRYFLGNISVDQHNYHTFCSFLKSPHLDSTSEYNLCLFFQWKSFMHNCFYKL